MSTKLFLFLCSVHFLASKLHMHRCMDWCLHTVGWHEIVSYMYVSIQEAFKFSFKVMTTVSSFYFPMWSSCAVVSITLMHRPLCEKHSLSKSGFESINVTLCMPEIIYVIDQFNLLKHVGILYPPFRTKPLCDKSCDNTFAAVHHGGTLPKVAKRKRLNLALFFFVWVRHISLNCGITIIDDEIHSWTTNHQGCCLSWKHKRMHI